MKKIIENSTKINNKNDNHKIFKDASVECFIIDYRLNVKIASFLKIPENANFPLFRVEKLTKKNKQQITGLRKTSITLSYETQVILNIREIESQTYTSTQLVQFEFEEKLILDYDIEAYNKSFTEKCIEDLVFRLFVKEKIEDKSFSFKQFISCFSKLSEDSIRYFSIQICDEMKFKNFLSNIKSIVKLNDEKLRIFDLLISKSIKNEPEINLEKLIKLAQIKQKDVRFETTQENKKAVLDRFKRVVRLIMCNREWIKQFNKKKIEEEEKILIDKYENDFLDCKKIGLLFNKEEFRAQKNLNNLINDFHKNILITPSQARTKDQIESLIELVQIMPRINSFPKHSWAYIAQIMNLLVYEKGREIVRTGHRAIGYYTIISCDVLSAGTNQELFKIEEFEAGDTFGDSSFSFSTGITPHTIITNQLTELLLIEPFEIEVYLSKLRLEEKEQMRSFCLFWRPFSYWNWEKENCEEFANKAEFLRFNNGEIVYDNSFKQIEKIYFILKGKIQLIRVLDVEQSLYKNVSVTENKLKSCNQANSTSNSERTSDMSSTKYLSAHRRKKLYSVCFFEKFNFFGMGDTSPMATEWFVACCDNVNVIRISKEALKSIHRHSCFLISLLNENYKLAIPSSAQCSEILKEKKRTEFRANK